MEPQLGDALAWLDARADPSARAEMDSRYGIHVEQALGVPMRDMKVLAKQLGRSHELAAALWATGGYEARTVAALVDEPERVTAEQMDRWAADFDNWAICDTVCFHLFDRAAPAWGRVPVWAGDEREFVRRGAFALIWALALHDRSATDVQFGGALVLIEEAADDDRPLVNKAVIMAVRAIAKKHPSMGPAVRAAGDRLVASDGAPARRVGRAVLRG